MTIRPGTNLLWLMGILLLWCLLGFVWAPSAWFLLPAVLLALGASLAEYRALRAGLSQLTVRRNVPVVVGRGRPFEVAVAVANASTEFWRADVRDEVPSAAQPRAWREQLPLPPGDSMEMARTFVIPVRGKYQFGPVWIRLRGRFGLLEAQQSFAVSDSCQVMPESLVSDEELRKDAADEIRLIDKLRNSRHRGVGTEFESLEEFRVGDDPRRMDWRATARLRRPVVRRFQIERHRDMLVLVDRGRLMGADAGQGTKLDCAVDAALRLIRVALRAGDRCGLAVFDDQVSGYLSPIGGAQAFSSFLGALYDIEPRWRETDFSSVFARLQQRQSKRALIVILSDMIDVETSSRYRSSLATLARRHVVLFAALRTPLLRQLVESPVEKLLDGFKKAVALRTLREREQAIHSLRRGGIHVLDVEPKMLTPRLVNEFIDLRQSNAL